MMKEYNREKLSLEETRNSYNDEIELLEQEMDKLKEDNKLAVDDM